MRLNKETFVLLRIVIAAIISITVITQIADAAPQLQTSPISHITDITAEKAGGLALPSDVVVVDNRIYIVDGGNHRVAVFDNRWKYLFSFGRQGSANDCFNGPVGIGADKKGNIYVADRGNHRIQVFDHDGKYLRSINVALGGKPVRPVDVAVTPDGNTLFVTGNNSHSVLVFNRNGQLLQNWGGSGSENGDFRYPAIIVLTANKKVAVVDILNTRVQIFEQNGEFVNSIGEWGVLSGQFVRPKGVVVDKDGRYFVSDSYMDLVQVFDDAGRFLYILGENGKPLTMTSPAGMAIDDSGRLYVAEMLENKVSVFALGR